MAKLQPGATPTPSPYTGQYPTQTDKRYRYDAAGNIIQENVTNTSPTRSGFAGSDIGQSAYEQQAMAALQRQYSQEDYRQGLQKEAQDRDYNDYMQRSLE